MKSLKEFLNESDNDKSIGIVNKALDKGREGDWDAAWKIARKDEKMNIDTTKEKWIEWAKTAIKNRKSNS